MSDYTLHFARLLIRKSSKILGVEISMSSNHKILGSKLKSIANIFPVTFGQICCRKEWRFQMLIRNTIFILFLSAFQFTSAGDVYIGSELDPSPGGSFSGGQYHNGDTIVITSPGNNYVNGDFDVDAATCDADGVTNCATGVRLQLKANNNISIQSIVKASGNVVVLFDSQFNIIAGGPQILISADDDQDGVGSLSFDTAAQVTTENGAILLHGFDVNIDVGPTFANAAETRVVGSGGYGGIGIQAENNLTLMPTSNANARVLIRSEMLGVAVQVGGNLVMAGGKSVGSNIHSSNGPVFVDVTGNATLTGGDSFNSLATIVGNSVTLNVGGNLALNQGAGNASGAFVGGSLSTDVTVGGNLTLQGGNVSGAVEVGRGSDVSIIEVMGDVMVLGGTAGGTNGGIASVGGTSLTLFAANITLQAGGQNTIASIRAQQNLTVTADNNLSITVPSGKDGVAGIFDDSSNASNAMLIHAGGDINLTAAGSASAFAEIKATGAASITAIADHNIALSGAASLIDSGSGPINLVADNLNRTRPHFGLGAITNNGGVLHSASGRILLYGVSPSLVTGFSLPNQQFDTYYGDPIDFSGNGIAYKLMQDGSNPSVTTFANISTRLAVGTGDRVLIGGFIITGPNPPPYASSGGQGQAKKVVVRAIGPSLTPLGVPNALADPVLEIHDGTGALIASNDNWQTTQIGGIITSDQSAEIQNSGLAPTNPAESALIAVLTPGNYTAIVRGAGGTTGVALVESYDVDTTSDSTLANISTRGFVQTGDNIMIAGLIVRGRVGTQGLLRGIGPSLAAAGVPDALQDPTLELRDANGALVAQNDNWKDTQQAEIEATTIPPTNDLESAIVFNLGVGNYTVQLRGKNGGTGVGLVEAYDLP
jgi:hypothetical protein